MLPEIEQELLVGWKQIAQFCGVKDIKTVKRWYKRLHMPVIYLGKSPVVLKQLLRMWLINLQKIVAEKETIKK